jgi:hypothetical protein
MRSSQMISCRETIYYREHASRTLLNIATFKVANIIDRKCRRKGTLDKHLEKTKLPLSLQDRVREAIDSFYFYKDKCFKIWKPNKDGVLEFKNNYKVKIRRKVVCWRNFDKIEFEKR